MMADKAEIRVGIIGLGTVGGGTATVLTENAGIIASRAIPIRLAAVADIDTARARDFLDKLGQKSTILYNDWHQMIDDPTIDIVVETIGGVNLAREVITAALIAGKTVVTANKDLLAVHGGELLRIAGEHENDLFFEASVAGGIPVIQTVKEALAGNRIQSIMGILNGTTNFILTRMSEDGTDFAEALAEAQALGYAEADPTADVEGWDAARKIAILSSIAFNSRVTYEMVPCEGITKISKWDIIYAKEFGYVIKMVGIARHQGCPEKGFIEARVHPLMLPANHPLATVRDSYNAVFIEGNAVERTMFYGRGAGALPTGSAIVGDIIQAARNIMHNSKARLGCTCHLALPVLPLDDVVSKYYIRVSVYDRVGVFAALSAALRDSNVSIDAVMQKRRINAEQAEIVMITHKVRHADMLAALSIIENLDCTCEVCGYIRVEDEES